MSFDAALEPLYDQECLSKEEHILIMLETILINNFLAGVKATEETIVDFEAELKFIADWLEEPKNAENVVYVCNEEGIRFAEVEKILLNHELMLQNYTAQNTADCRRAWMSITNVAEFVELEGRSRTAEAQSNNRMHYASMCEDFKLSNWKSRKRGNINKYYLIATKVKMKKMEDCRVQRLESQIVKLFADL